MYLEIAKDRAMLIFWQAKQVYVDSWKSLFLFI